MSRFTVQLLPRAQDDFDRIHAWLRERSTEGAVAWVDAFTSAIESLEREPSAFGFASERILRRLGMRQKLFKTRHGLEYRLLYLTDQEKVLVVRLRGPGQPPVRLNEVDP